MKNILTEALVNSATNASFIFSYTNSAKLRVDHNKLRFFMVKHFHNNPLYKNLQMRNWFLCKLKLTKIKDKLSEC